MKTLKTIPSFPVGALEVILECQEILAGKRDHLTSLADYTQQRRRYWQMQALRPRERRRAALSRQQAA
jgi:hypothetical protein